MDDIETFDESEDIQNYESYAVERRSEEYSEFTTDRHVKKSIDYTKPVIYKFDDAPGSTESWEETDQFQECESAYLETKMSKKYSKSKDEEEVDLLLAKSQEDLDALLAKTAGSIDQLLDQTSENIDQYLLDKPIERKKSKKHKDSKEATEEFGDKPERKKSKKHKDKEVEDSFETDSISSMKHKEKKYKDKHDDAQGEEEGQTGDGEKKKKRRKKGEKKDSKSTATSRGVSPTPSTALTEIEVEDDGEPSKWTGKCVPMSYEKPYRVPVGDRYKQITRDVNKLGSTIHNLYEKEKLYKIRMLQQKYWFKPESKLYHTNLDYQEKPYNNMIDYLDRKEKGLIPEREPHRPKPNAFVCDYDKRAEESRRAFEREEMEETRIKRIMSAPSPRDVIYSSKSSDMKTRDTLKSKQVQEEMEETRIKRIRSASSQRDVIFSSKSSDMKTRDTLQSKQVQTDVPDIFIPHGPNQCVIPTRLSGESRGINMAKEVYSDMPVSQSVQTETPVTLCVQTINTTPSEVQRPVSDVDNSTLALAATMTRLAASRLEEARVEREREDKLIFMNNKLMDSLQSLGRCVENLAVDRAPVQVNQYNAVTPNIAFYQEQLARLDTDTRKYKNQYLEQEPLYTPGNISYHEHPFENIKESNYKSIGCDDYKPTYKETQKHCITDKEVTTMLNQIHASRNRHRARTEEEFEEQEAASGFLDKFDPNWKFDTTILEDKDREKTAEIVHSNYMRVRHAQLRASQRNAIHGH